MNEKCFKNQMLVRIVAGILIILYHIIIFAIPFRRSGLFWISYIFTLISFGVAYYAFRLSYGKNLKSRFYGFPIMKVGFLYAVIQLIVAFVMMCFSKYVSVGMGLVVFSILLAVALIGLIAVEVVRSEIEIGDDSLTYKVATMRNLQSIIEELQKACKNPNLTGMVKEVAEKLRYSDPVSSPRLEKMEEELIAEVSSFREAVMKDEVIAAKELYDKVIFLINERNRLCCLYKRG